MTSFSDLNGQIGFCVTSPGQVILRAVCGYCCALGSTEDAIVTNLYQAFGCRPDQDAQRSYRDFGSVVRACGLGHFWKKPLFEFGLERLAQGRAVETGNDYPVVKSRVFVSRWLQLKRRHELGRSIHICVDPCSLFVALLSRGEKNRLSSDNLISWVEDVADSALDLTDSYLREPYVDTVLARLLLRYGVHLTGSLTETSLKMSGFAYLLERLGRCTTLIPRIRRSLDLNLVLNCTEEELDLPDEFSYDDFLAIFGLYWELTSKQRSLDSIPEKDLCDYTPLSKRFLSQIFKVDCVRPFSDSADSISYPDFVWLIVSAEGKGCWSQSAEYLFRVLDLESDGVLTPDELHYFYQDHSEKKNKSTRSFQDVMCELVDAVRPADPGRFTLMDIRRSGLAHVFFSPFVDAPDSHHHHSWTFHRRRGCHSSWWPQGSIPESGLWECFVQDRLDYMRDSEQEQNNQPKESPRNMKHRLGRKHGRNRTRKPRNKSF